MVSGVNNTMMNTTTQLYSGVNVVNSSSLSNVSSQQMNSSFWSSSDSEYFSNLNNTTRANRHTDLFDLSHFYTYYIYNFFSLVGSDDFDVENWVFVIGSACGMILNGFIMVLIAAKRRLRKQQNIFIFNLALADFTTALLTFVLYTVPKKSYDGTFVRTFLSLLFSTSFESATSVLGVAAYRYISICLDPFGSRGLLTSARCVFTCILTWACVCAVFSTAFHVQNEAVKTSLSAFAYAIAILLLVVMGACYALIYREMARKRDGATAKRMEENKRILHTFALLYGLAVTFWVCPLAAMYQHLFQSNRLYEEDSLRVKLSGIAMLNVNLIINPIIYCWRLKDFRACLPMPTCCRDNRVREDWSILHDTRTSGGSGTTSKEHTNTTVIAMGSC